jgi:hypothetical protein
MRREGVGPEVDTYGSEIIPLSENEVAALEAEFRPANLTGRQLHLLYQREMQEKEAKQPMAFRASDGSFLSEWYARKQGEFYSHVPVWVAVGAAACEASGRRLTHAEYHGLIELLDGMNSYTRKVLLPVLDDLAVCELASYRMSQSGRELGELDLPRDYNEAVEKELAPLLVKRLRESAGLLNMTRKYAEEWGRWRETIEHLKKTAAGQQKRADKLEQRLDDARQSILCVAEERDDARAQLRAASAELDHARREAAAWEVQCQDLRDRVVQVEAESARRYDCHGGPGTIEPACGGCVSCLLRALEQVTHERDALAGNLGRPWGLPSVLERLAEAADHLLNDHNCDIHGHEGIGLARDEARLLLAALK